MIVQVPRSRLFYSPGQQGSSERLLDVLPKRLVLDKGFSLRSRGHTPFHQAKVVPIKDMIPGGVLELSRVKAGSVQETETQLLARAVVRIKQILQEGWHTGRNVVMHSSGYDSRILSYIIKMLGYENVVFVCIGPECEMAKQILHYEGWDDEHMVLWADMDHYYQQCADFDWAWQWINGTASSLFNLIWVGVPEEVGRVWIGYGTDYCLRGAGDRKGNRLLRWYTKSYWATTSLPLAKGPVVYPYQDQKLLEIVAQSSVRLGYRIRERLIAYLDPGLLAFPRVDQRYPDISRTILSRCEEDYKQSWYGKMNSCPASADPANTVWWSRWATAAYCEHLVKAGYKLR